MPSLPDGQPAVFDRWLASVGVFVEPNKPIAIVLFSGRRHQLYSNMAVMIHDISSQAAGTIEADQLMCLALAEGDAIPYGQPYARLEEVA